MPRLSAPESHERSEKTLNHKPRLSQDHGNIDVVTLFAPGSLPDAEFEGSVAEWSSHARAVLVVLPYRFDESSLDRLHIAGADLCVVAPTPNDLCAHVERARRRHRTMHTGRTIRDEQLDALWRERVPVPQPP